jgi:hypothetical protein
MLRPRLAMLGSGLAAGLISSLAISALLLLVERISELPVGTFYLVLVAAVMQTPGFYSINANALGFLMHLAAGSILGLAISVPFTTFKRSSSDAFRGGGAYAPAYGLFAGFALWAVLFLPVTYLVMLPLLNPVERQNVIVQSVPTGEASSIVLGQLNVIIDRVIIGSLAFNLFYGLLTLMLTRSLYQAYLSRNKVAMLSS